MSLESSLRENSYPGRGIVVGRSDDGKYAVCAYFIMGRSANSRNRVFVEVPEDNGIETLPFDVKKLEDPSLIIYHPVRVDGPTTIVTNGDQTDTIRNGLDKGFTFEQSLRSRTFEPDAPNFTPRISAVLNVHGGKYDYQMSIIKSEDGTEDRPMHCTYSYCNPLPGEGHFIHTYAHDGNPLPSFAGEPERVKISGDIDDFALVIWDSLNRDNRVSLFVRYIDIETGAAESRIINVNK
ncbi:MAG: IMP cyclohydrolase [Lachnospiraceae bacterium]|nr:IMP cyclohydrolase [Lachnospiraceae bacterium]